MAGIALADVIGDFFFAPEGFILINLFHLGIANEQFHHELQAAQARRAAINQTIADLELERASLDRRIADLIPRASDDGLPCWSCPRPEGKDARHFLGANQDPAVGRTASGLPLCCCRLARAQTGSTIVHHA
jgi:hypothetical protein